MGLLGERKKKLTMIFSQRGEEGPAGWIEAEGSFPATSPCHSFQELKHLHLYALKLIYGGNYILACQLWSHKTKFIGITCLERATQDLSWRNNK